MTYDLRALIVKQDAPLTSVLAIETSPGRVMEIDRLHWEATKEQFVAFCESIPGVETGPSYQALKLYTNGNGDLAKLLIALGELAGVWKMHPPLRHPELWGKARQLYPMIAAEPRPAPAHTPKPSTGDLEKGVTDCGCCGRSMGPTGSLIHDLVAGPEHGFCSECEEAGCDGVTCRVDELLTAALRSPSQQQPRRARVVEDFSDEVEAPDGIDAYLSQFGGSRK